MANPENIFEQSKDKKESPKLNQPVGEDQPSLEKNPLKLQQERENKISEARKEVEAIEDRFDMKVEPGIKETVVGLRAFDLPTYYSCEGHVDQKSREVPYVDVSPDVPEERFEGQKAAFAKAAEKYGLSAEAVARADNMDAYKEAMAECSQNKETKEYQEYRAKMQKHKAKMETLLSEFYHNRPVAPETKIIVDEYTDGGIRMRNHNGEDYQHDQDLLKDLEDSQKAATKEKLLAYQKEMMDFAEFLQERFIKQGN